MKALLAIKGRKINIEILPVGMYLIKIIYENGEMEMGKFSVMR